MCIVLILALSAALLAIPPALLMNKYRSYLAKLVMICAALFAGLLLADSLIYWSFMSAERQGAMVLDWTPFPSLVMFTLNWQVPCLIVVMVATLMFLLTRGKRAHLHLWITLAVMGIATCAFLVLAHKIWSYCMLEGLRTMAWWL
ncbi:MAG: hypothetical protein ACYTEX_05710 [Planctomycetota bacterium]